MIKVTALVITLETVGESMNYSRGYARDVPTGDSFPQRLCLYRVWPFRILAAMTALLMELKGNRAHSHWWFRQLAIYCPAYKSILCATMGKQSEEDKREHHCPELVLLTVLHAAPPPWQLCLRPRCRVRRQAGRQAARHIFLPWECLNTWYRIAVATSRVNFAVVCHQNYKRYINKLQQDAIVCRYLFTAISLYMFRVSIAPIIRSI